MRVLKVSNCCRMLVTIASNTEISLMTIATLLQVKQRSRVGVRKEACYYSPKLIAALPPTPRSPPLQHQAFVVPLGACIFLLNEPLPLVSLPEVHPLYWSWWELKFYFNHFTPLLKHLQWLLTTHSIEESLKDQIHVQGHRDTFPSSLWELSGSLNICYIFLVSLPWFTLLSWH